MAARIAVSAALTALIAMAGIQGAAAQRADGPDPTVASSRERPAEIVRSDEQQARDWGLRTEDWARYRELMQGPLGVHSPNLDPLTALGIEARSDEERRRIAELQVQVETRQIERLLAYQRAYDEAWRRLHPGLQRVVLPGAVGATQPAAIAASDRTAVFVRDLCDACDEVVQRMQASGAEFDVYMVGSRADDARIRTWARRARIDPARVREGGITLNHDGGRWLSLGMQGDLPAVVRQVDGRWQRQP